MEPVMQLVVKDRPEEVVALACAKCGTVYRKTDMGPYSAAGCCMPYLCSGCGKELPRKENRTVCRECNEKRREKEEAARVAKAERISWKDYDGEFVYLEGIRSHDDYCPTNDLADTLTDFPADKRPKYVWACCEMPLPKPDADDIAEGLTQDMAESAIEDLDTEGLQKVLDKWWAKQTVHSFEPDNKIVVLDELLEQVANEEAKKASK